MSLLKVKDNFSILPNNWEIVSIGELLLSTQYGTSEANSSSGIRVIGMKNIQDGKILLDDTGFVDLKKEEEEELLLNKGDILLNRTNSYELVGKVGHFNSTERAVFASYLVRLVVNGKKADSRYLCHWLNGYVAQKIIKKIATRAISQANVNPTEFKKYCFVPTAPLPEQKAIADLLSTWDAAIEKTERLIEAKEKHHKQISEWLLFGHKRLFEKKYKMINSHLFSVPSDWKIVNIGSIGKEINKRNTEPEATVLSCSKHEGFVNSLEYFGKKVYSDDISNYKIIKKWQFGYPANHIEEGSIGFLEHCDYGIVSPIYIVFEIIDEKVYPPFLYKILKTAIYRHIFRISTSASVDRRGSLRWDEFSKIKVPVPTIVEQKEIVKLIDIGNREIELLKNRLQKLKEQKRGLMQKLLTGEWRVKL